MSSRVRPCCVPECNDRQAKRHRITSSEKCRNIWFQRIKNDKLRTLDNKSLQSHRICDIHFEDVCKDSNGRLKNGSLPTINLPGYEKVENDTFLPPSPEEKFHTPEKLKDALQVLDASTSHASGSSPVGSVMKPQRVYGKRLFIKTLDFSGDIETYEPAKQVLRKDESPGPSSRFQTTSTSI